MPVISDSGFLRREADGTWRVLGTWLADARSLLVGELDRNPERKEVLVGGGAYRLGEAGSGAVQFATIPETARPTLLDLDGDGHLDVLGVASNPVGATNRLVLAQLDGFAHDLHAYLTTGVRIGAPAKLVDLATARRGA